MPRRYLRPSSKKTQYNLCLFERGLFLSFQLYPNVLEGLMDNMKDVRNHRCCSWQSYLTTCLHLNLALTRPGSCFHCLWFQTRNHLCLLWKSERGTGDRRSSQPLITLFSFLKSSALLTKRISFITSSDCSRVSLGYSFLKCWCGFSSSAAGCWQWWHHYYVMPPVLPWQHCSIDEHCVCDILPLLKEVTRNFCLYL